MAEDEKNKLFAELFNDCKTVTSTLTDDQLNELIESIQNDAFEAKARLCAAQEELRERKAQ